MRILFLQDTTTAEASKTDDTYDLANSTLITEVVMHFSLIAATFPCLRKFLQAFDMHMGATTNLNHDGGSRSTDYGLKSLSRSGGSSHPGIYRAMPPDASMGNVTVVTTIGAGPQSPFTPAERRSEESVGSQQVMIRKTQRWEVSSIRD